MEPLSPAEARVLGCLIEKEATTPDAYPLTMNALVLACNQTSNRTPVVAYDEATVTETMLRLRERKMARVVHSAHGSRVPKYRHALAEVWAITQAELAVLAVLLLRGPQTVNELGTRTERYRADLDDLGGVQGVLDRLAARDDPMTTCLGRQPGQREERWAQLLAGEPVVSADTPLASAGPAVPGVRTYPPARERHEPGSAAEDARRLRDDVDQLRREVDALRGEVDRLLGRPEAG